MPDGFRFDTRDEFIRSVKEKFPERVEEFQNDDDLYASLISEFPVYENQIRQNVQPLTQPEFDTSQKTWGDAFSEYFMPKWKTMKAFILPKFGRDVPMHEVAPGFVNPTRMLRDGEIGDTIELMLDARAVKNNTATEKQRLNVARAANDAQRPNTKAYRVWKVGVEIPEFVLTFWLGGTATKFAGKALEGVAKKGSKVAAKTAVQGFAKALQKNAWGAALQTAKTQGTKAGLRMGLKNLAIRAPVRAAFMPGPWLDSTLQYMTPQFSLEKGEMDEMKLRLADPADDFWEALAKGYGDTVIEAFSEETAEVLPILGAGFGKSGALPFKIAVLNRFNKIRPQTNSMKRAAELLRAGGWHGVIGEMFEERVGGVLRTAVGLQDPGLPSLDQLTTEALAFSIPGLSMTAGNLATGGLGPLGMQESEDAVRNVAQPFQTKREFQNNRNRLNELMDEQSDPWYKGLKWMEKMFGERRRGSVEDLLARINVTETEQVYRQAESDKTGTGPSAVDAYIREKFNITLAPNETVRDRLKQEADAGNIVVARRKGKPIILANRQAIEQDDFKEITAESDIALLTPIGEADTLIADGEITVDDINAAGFMDRVFKIEDAGEAENFKTRLLSLIGDPQLGARFTMTVPAVFTGTRQEFLDIAEYAVPENAPRFATEEGNPIYALWLGARNNAVDGTISINPFTRESDLGEDALEFKFKQSLGKQLTGAAEEWNSDFGNRITNVITETPKESDRVLLRHINDMSPFERFIKGYLYSRLGYTAEGINEGFDRLAEFGFPMEANVDAYMRDRIGEELLGKLAITPVEPVRGERQTRVRELVTERRGIKEARALTEEARGEQLIDQLADVLQADMRTAENRQAALDIMNQIEAAGITFSLEEMDAIEKMQDRLTRRTVPIGKIDKELERIRQKREGEQPFQFGERLAQLEGVFSNEELNELVPEWMKDDTELIDLFGDNIDRNIVADIVARAATERKDITGLIEQADVDPNIDINELREVLAEDVTRALIGVRTSLRRFRPVSPMQQTIEVGEGRRLIAPSAVSIFEEQPVFESEEEAVTGTEVAENISNEELAALEEAGEDIPATRPGRVRTDRPFTGIRGAAAQLEATRKSIDRLRPVTEDLSTGEQTERIVMSGMGQARDLGRAISENAESRNIEIQVLSDKTTRPMTAQQIRDASPFGVPFSLVRDALYDGNLDVDGWVVLLDFETDTKEIDLGAPMLSLVQGALTGDMPMGFVQRGNIDDRLARLVDPIVEADLPTEADAPGAFRAVLPISSQAVQERSTARTAGQIRDWQIRNNIRRLGIALIDTNNRNILNKFRTTLISSMNIGRSVVREQARIRPLEAVQAPLRAVAEPSAAEIPPGTEITPSETFSPDLAQRQAETMSLRTDAWDAMMNFNNNQMPTDQFRRLSDALDAMLRGDRAVWNSIYRNLSLTDQKTVFPDLAAVSNRNNNLNEEQTERDIEQTEFDFNVSSSLNFSEDTVLRVNPLLTEGAAGLHRLLLDVHRDMRDRQNRSIILANTWEREAGLQRNPDHPTWDITPEHKQLARQMLEAVGVSLEEGDQVIVNRGPFIGIMQPNGTFLPASVLRGEDLGKIEGRRIYELSTDNPKVADILSRWNTAAKQFPGMWTSDKFIEETRKAYAEGRNEANIALGEFTQDEWIREVTNYVNHQYQRSRDMTETEFENAKKRLVEETQRAKQRRYPTYQAAAKRGLMPITQDVTKLFKMWNDKVWQIAAQKIFLNNAVLVRGQDNMPQMIANISETFRGDRIITSEYERRMRKLIADFAQDEQFELDEDGNIPVPELEARGYNRIESPFESIESFWVREGLPEKVLNNLLGTGRVEWRPFGGRDWLRGMERFNAHSKAGMLFLSMFHPFSLTESLIASTGANPVKIVETFKSLPEINRQLKADSEFSGRWIRKGLVVGQTDPNITQGIVDRDWEAAIKWMGSLDIPFAKEFEKKGGVLFDMKKKWDRMLWDNMHPTYKLAAAELLLGEIQNNFEDRGIEWTDELQDQKMEQIAQAVNDAFGGQEWERYVWASPRVRQLLHLGMFAPDWTLSAANIAGATSLPGINKIVRPRISGTQADFMLRKYWPSMIAIVLLGIPNALQSMIYLAFGDDEEGDMPLTFQNERGKKTHIDFTPMLRKLGWVPIIGFKGGESGKRRVYLRWGKQAYEVFEGWGTRPVRTLMNKSSSVVRTAYEQATGTNTAGWELPFKDEGIGGALEVNGSFLNSRTGFVVQKFIPISILSILQGRPTAFFAPASRGASRGTAIHHMRRVLEAYANPGVWSKITGNARLETNLANLMPDIIDAAERNGVDPESALQIAAATTRSKWYKKLFQVIDRDNEHDTEIAARAIIRLNGSIAGARNSIRRRMEAVNRLPTPEIETRLTAAFEDMEVQ